jgi:hypothetical protein
LKKLGVADRSIFKRAVIYMTDGAGTGSLLTEVWMYFVKRKQMVLLNYSDIQNLFGFVWALLDWNLRISI